MKGAESTGAQRASGPLEVQGPRECRVQESAGSKRVRGLKKRRVPERASSETSPKFGPLRSLGDTVRYSHGSIKSTLSHTHTGTARNYS